MDDEAAERYELATGAPNQHCADCRRFGICAYHRDWPHNIGGRREYCQHCRGKGWFRGLEIPCKWCNPGGDFRAL